MNIKILIGVLFVMSTIVKVSLSHADAIWIDVRSAEEHEQSNIHGDIRISHTDIVPEVSRLFPDRNTEIRLYCRSGRRSGIAMSALLEAGYTNVSNAGGIDDARQARELNSD